MRSSLLRHDGPLHRLCAWYSALAFANLLWVVASLPVATAPPATAAMFAALHARRARGGGPVKVGDFTAGLRRDLAASYAVTGAQLGAAGLLAADLAIAIHARQPLLAGALLAVTIAVAMLAAHAWPALLICPPGLHRARRVGRTVLMRTATRPSLAAAAIGCWGYPVLVVAFAPRWLLVPALAVVVSLPASVTLALSARATSHTGEPQDVEICGR